MGVIGTLIAYADSAGSRNPETLTAEGEITARTRAVVSGEYAYLLGQPEIIAADITLDKTISSPQGDSLLVVAHKRPPFRGIVLDTDKENQNPGEFNLIYWNARTRIAKTLFREAARDSVKLSDYQIEWLPQTQTALVMLDHVTKRDGQPENFSQSLFRVDALAGTFSRIAGINDYTITDGGEGFTSAYLEVSPSRPLAYVVTVTRMATKAGPLFRSSFQICTSRGLRPPVAVPSGAASWHWLPDGRTAYCDYYVERGAKGEPVRHNQLTVLDVETGEMTQPDKLPVISKADRAKVPASTSESWPLDIAAPVFRVPATAFEQALRGIQRTATMSSAKQIGLAVMGYAQDYDENLPQPGSGVQDAVGPYLKNPSVFENPGTGENGFTYSYSGPTGFGQIGQPSTTQLGFVSGPGGRAVIWGDGHVTWQDAP